MAKIVIERTGDWIKAAVKLYSLQCKIRKLKEDEKLLVDKLKVLSEGVSSKGAGFEFNRIDRAGSIHYSAIPGIKDLDLEPYRGKPISFWKLNKKW